MAMKNIITSISPNSASYNNNMNNNNNPIQRNKGNSKNKIFYNNKKNNTHEEKHNKSKNIKRDFRLFQIAYMQNRGNTKKKEKGKEKEYNFKPNINQKSEQIFKEKMLREENKEENSSNNNGNNNNNNKDKDIDEEEKIKIKEKKKIKKDKEEKNKLEQKAENKIIDINLKREYEETLLKINEAINLNTKEVKLNNYLTSNRSINNIDNNYVFVNGKRIDSNWLKKTEENKNILMAKGIPEDKKYLLESINQCEKRKDYLNKKKKR